MISQLSQPALLTRYCHLLDLSCPQCFRQDVVEALRHTVRKDEEIGEKAAEVRGLCRERASERERTRTYQNKSPYIVVGSRSLALSLSRSLALSLSRSLALLLSRSLTLNFSLFRSPCHRGVTQRFEREPDQVFLKKHVGHNYWNVQQ